MLPIGARTSVDRCSGVRIAIEHTGWWSECVCVFVGGTCTGSSHTCRQYDHTERTAPLGACRNIPCLTPTVTGCAGLTKEQYHAEVRLVWGELEGLLRAWPMGEYRAVFARKFDDERLRWYNCFLTMNDLDTVVARRGEVCEAVVSCMAGLLSCATIHARRSDGSYKFACVPCKVLRRARDRVCLDCETMTALLREADIVFAPVSLGSRFILIHCDKVKHTLSCFDPCPIEDSEDAEKIWETFEANARALVFVFGCHGMATTFADWEMRLLPNVVVEDVVAPLTCTRPHVDAHDSGMYVVATMECLVCGKDPSAIHTYMPMYNYRKHVMWLLMHWHLHGVWPGYVGEWWAST
jgi:hypothetical protein